MKRWVYGILAVALVVVVGLSSCGRQQAGGPQPGDTVKPALAGLSSWSAGQEGRLGVRLQAQAPGTSVARGLDFMPGVSANPAATITFFDGEQQLGSPVQVALSHRC